jgi:predicted RNA-binding protein YlxR (DUF448 family)
MAARRMPMRRCIACRASRPKAELVRVVRTPSGAIEIDITGRTPGRGAYVCRRAECMDVAGRRDVIRRALGQPLPQEALEQMRNAAGGAEPGSANT